MIHSYKCKDCNKEFSVSIKNECGFIPVCPECKSSDVVKQFGGHFILKGGVADWPGKKIAHDRRVDNMIRRRDEKK